MGDKLKGAGCVLLFFLGPIVAIALLGLILSGADWVSQRLLPWFFLASWFALGLLVVVLLPLAAIRRTRSFASMAMMVVSYVFGATLWMEGLVLTMSLWGWIAVVIGLLVAGVGVVPIAMIATLSKGMWPPLAELVVLTILTFGVRVLALWVDSKTTSPAKAQRIG